jgi:high-affinity iron transporter
MAAGALLSTVFIAARESLEAFLIMGILGGMAVKLGHPEARRNLLLGGLLGLLVSVVAGVGVIAGAREAVSAGGEVVALGASMLAVAILTYMVVWMYRHTIQLMGSLHGKTKAALEAGKPAALASLAFIAVVREGVETAAFLATGGGNPTDLALGVLGGLALSAAIAALVFSGLLRLSIERFFLFTGVLLVGFATYMIGHELSGVVVGDLHVAQGDWVGWGVAALYALALLAFLFQSKWRKTKTAQTL